MKELIFKIAEPIQDNLIHFSVAFIGILSTVTCFIPKDSKLGKVLRFFTNKIISLKDKIIKK